MSSPDTNVYVLPSGSGRGCMPADTDQELQAFRGFVGKKSREKCRNAFERNHYTHALWVRFCGQWLAKEVL